MMHHYKYLPLEDENSIRLMTVLPGKFDDLIRAEITHEPLVPPDKVVLSVKEINRSLPQNWEARETLEGRILFLNS